VYIVQHLNAMNDNNGNPRRLFLVLNTSDGKVTAYDEGYQGEQAMPEAVRVDNVRMPSLVIRYGAYRDILKQYGA
jgi:hypothetical protein